MHPVVRTLQQHAALLAVVAFVVGLVLAVTAIPGRAVSILHVQLSILALVCGPAVVGTLAFAAVADDPSPSWLLLVGVVGVFASLVSLFVGFLAVVGGRGPYLSPEMPAFQLYEAVDNAVQFGLPTLVFAGGATVCGRVEGIARLAVLAATTVALVPATVVAASVVPWLVL